MPNTRYTFKELDERYVEPIKALIHDIVYPEKRYLGYRNSATIILKDGRTVSLLQFLAKLKYGQEYNMQTSEAIWTDTNWYNATPDNITILSREVKTTKRAGRPSKLNLGVPYGHPDYQRRYLEATRDKQREYRRSRYVKKRYAAIEALDQKPAPDDVNTPTTSTAEDEASLARLNDILLSSQVRTASGADVPTPSTRPPVRWSEIQSSDIPSKYSKDYLDGITSVPAPSPEERK